MYTIGCFPGRKSIEPSRQQASRIAVFALRCRFVKTTRGVGNKEELDSMLISHHSVDFLHSIARGANHFTILSDVVQAACIQRFDCTCSTK